MLRNLHLGAAYVLLYIGSIGLVAPSFAQSEACEPGIQRLQEQLNSELSRRASAGPFGKESPSATLGHQPTPATLANAEVRLGDWRHATEAVAALQRAKDAQARGDRRRCHAALQTLRELLNVD